MGKVFDALARVPSGSGVAVVEVKPNAPRKDRVIPTFHLDEFFAAIREEPTAVSFREKADKFCVSVVPASTWVPYHEGDREVHRVVFAPHLTTGENLGTFPPGLVDDFASLISKTAIGMYHTHGNESIPLLGQLFGFEYGKCGPQSGESCHLHVLMPNVPLADHVVGTGLTSSQRIKLYGPLNQLVEGNFNQAVMEFAADLGINAELIASHHLKNKLQPKLNIRLTNSTELKDYLAAIYKIGDKLNRAYLLVWETQANIYLSPNQDHRQLREQCLVELTGMGVTTDLAKRILKTGKILFRPTIEMLDKWLETGHELVPEVRAKIEKRKNRLVGIKIRVDMIVKEKWDSLPLGRQLVVDQAGGIEKRKRLSLLPVFGCPFRIQTNDYEIVEGKLVVHSFDILPQFGTDGNTGESELMAMCKR